jgi:hypothetical protein
LKIGEALADAFEEGHIVRKSRGLKKFKENLDDLYKIIQELDPLSISISPTLRTWTDKHRRWIREGGVDEERQQMLQDSLPEMFSSLALQLPLKFGVLYRALKIRNWIRAGYELPTNRSKIRHDLEDTPVAHARHNVMIALQYLRKLR